MSSSSEHPHLVVGSGEPVHKSASVQMQAMAGGVQPAPAMPSYLMSTPALSPSLPGTANTNANPFILKFKTKQKCVRHAARTMKVQTTQWGLW